MEYRRLPFHEKEGPSISSLRNRHGMTAGVKLRSTDASESIHPSGNQIEDRRAHLTV